MESDHLQKAAVPHNHRPKRKTIKKTTTTQIANHVKITKKIAQIIIIIIIIVRKIKTRTIRKNRRIVIKKKVQKIKIKFKNPLVL